MNEFAIKIQADLTKKIQEFAQTKEAAVNAVTADSVNKEKTDLQAKIGPAEKDLADAKKYFPPTIQAP